MYILELQRTEFCILPPHGNKILEILTFIHHILCSFAKKSIFTPNLVAFQTISSRSFPFHPSAICRTTLSHAGLYKTSRHWNFFANEMLFAINKFKYLHQSRGRDYNHADMALSKLTLARKCQIQSDIVLFSAPYNDPL